MKKEKVDLGQLDLFFLKMTTIIKNLYRHFTNERNKESNKQNCPVLFSLATSFVLANGRLTQDGHHHVLLEDLDGAT